jgi:hypothetical protein
LVPVNGTLQGVQGKNIFLATPIRQVAKSSQSYTNTLNSFFDRLFSYLNELADTQVDYFELKLKQIMDILGEQMFRVIDGSQQPRGYCMAWEIYDFLRNPAFLFRNLRAPEDELQTFMKFVAQVAALDEEARSSSLL